MTSTGNTPAVATRAGSFPSVEGLGELLAKFADELSAWSKSCDDARYYGGPTIYPEALFKAGVAASERRADQIAKAVRALLDRAREVERKEEEYRGAFEENRRLTAERDRMAGLLGEAKVAMAGTDWPVKRRIEEALSSTQSDGRGE